MARINSGTGCGEHMGGRCDGGRCDGGRCDGGRCDGGRREDSWFDDGAHARRRHARAHDQHEYDEQLRGFAEQVGLQGGLQRHGETAWIAESHCESDAG